MSQGHLNPWIHPIGTFTVLALFLSSLASSFPFLFALTLVGLWGIVLGKLLFVLYEEGTNVPHFFRAHANRREPE